MHLRTLAVEASDLARLPKEPVFRWLVHHVREAFVTLLPAGFEVDASGKIQITCGPRGLSPQYEQVLGTSNYFVEDFDFKEFFAASPLERDELILATIETSLISIA